MSNVKCYSHHRRYQRTSQRLDPTLLRALYREEPVIKVKIKTKATRRNRAERHKWWMKDA